MKARTRSQLTLLPECLEDWVSEDNAVHVNDVFVEALDLHGMGFERVIARGTGRHRKECACEPCSTDHYLQLSSEILHIAL